MKISPIGSSRGLARLLVTVFLATAWNSGAFAQNDGAVDTNSTSPQLMEIIVTAEKHKERLQDVPAVISVISNADLARYDTNSLVGVGETAPSMMISRSSGGTTGGAIILRGISSGTSSYTSENAVVVNLDGIEVSEGNVLALGLVDTDRIEVLKGPQALFYGKNSPGGVVSIISNNPTKDFEGKLTTGYEFEAQKPFVDGYFSGPLTSTVGLRLAGYYSHENGYYYNDASPTPAVAIPASLGGGIAPAGQGSYESRAPNQADYVGRGTLTYKSPGGGLDATLKITYGGQDRKGGLTDQEQLFACGGNGTPFLVRTLNNGGSTDCSLNRYINDADAPPTYAAIAPAFGNGHLYFRNNQFLTSLTVNWQPIEQLTITSISGVYNLTEDFNSNFSFSSLYVGGYTSQLDVNQLTQEFRATTNFPGVLNFMVGAYYQHEDTSGAAQVIQEDPFTTLFTGGHLHGTAELLNPATFQNTQSWSPFAQVIAKVTSKLQFSAGGRYSQERKRVSAIINPTPFNAAPYDVTFTPDHRTWNDFSPAATLTYKPLENLTLYSAYREGFEAGGFNLDDQVGGFGTRNVGDVSYSNEKARGEEIGAKGTLMDGQIQFSTDLYNYKYSGLQTVAYDPQRLTDDVTNAGAARVKGVDMLANFRPKALQGLSLRSSINYNVSRYIAFRNSPCYSGQSQAAGCSFIASAAGISPALPTQKANAEDLSGQLLADAPVWAADAGATYAFGVGRGFMLSLSGDGVYTGAYRAGTDPRSFMKSAWRLNAGAMLQSPDDRWELALDGTNLTNVVRTFGAYAASLTGTGTGTTSSTPSDLVGSSTPPITVTLSGTVRF